MKKTMRSEWVKCGKAGCGGCPHGPYWYAYWKVKGKLHKEYIGRELPKQPGAGKAAEEKAHPWDAIMNDSTASVHLACDILGISVLAPYEAARMAYRTLAKEHHPDREGDPWKSCRINAAWGYLRSVHNWK